MRQFWFKIYFPEQAETRIFWMNLPPGNDVQCYDQLKHNVRNVFKLADDYDFYFTHTDSDNDEIAIKENDEILNYMFRMEQNDKLKLTITPISQTPLLSQKSQEKRPLEDVESDDTSSVASIAESFQSIMKHIELGMSNLQATVEKNAASVATGTVDTVVKAAAETAAHVYRSMLPPPTPSEKPQFDVICDGCYTPIRGQRWRCETCDDFDLCSTCKARVNHNQTHNFRFIKNEVPSHSQKENIVPLQSNSRAESCQSNPSHTIFICDFCDSDIVGIRHTCGACPDFDLCHSCFAIVKENHPEHIFVTRLVGTHASKGKKSKSSKCKKSKAQISPRQSPDNKVIPTVHHRGVECDNCDANIIGIRYKCGHCANYDLCETCEEYALSIHDSTHSFIKIRYPIQSIIKKPMLPTFTALKEKNGAKYTTTRAPTAAPNTREMETVNAAIPRTNELFSKPEEIVASSPSSSSPAVMNPALSPPVVAPAIAQNTVHPILSASFVSDINIPDGTLIVPKKTFIKMWKIVNDGNIDWPVGTHLLFNGGNILRPYPISRPDSFVVPVVSPYEEACITAELQAPDCPGEYSSYFCLCTPDGVRFGDSLWCTIKVDEDREPEEKNQPTAADIMVNSSNSMIYPTVLTASSSLHQDGQQTQDQIQNNDGYTDHDDYSEFTTDHGSPLASEITRSSFTNSHLSSPSTSELDIGESSRESYFPVEDTEEEEENEEFINRAYQVISPSASTTITTAVDEPVEEEEEEDFVIVDNEQEDNVVEESIASQDSGSGQNTAASSIHSSRTVTSRTNTVTSRTKTVTSRTNSVASRTNSVSVSEEYVYRFQLLQLHEMGFTSYDDLAITLLNSHQGRVEDVLAKLLEYP